VDFLYLVHTFGHIILVFRQVGWSKVGMFLCYKILLLLLLLDWRIILRWIFRKWEGVVVTGWS